MLSFLYNLSTAPRPGQAAVPRMAAPLQSAPHGQVGAGFSQPPLAGRSQRSGPPLPVRSPRAKRHPTVKSALAQPAAAQRVVAASRAAAPRPVAPCQAAPHGKVGAGFSQPPLPVWSRRPNRRSSSGRLAPTSFPHPRGEAPARDAARGVKPHEAPGRPGGTTGGGREDAGLEPSARAPRLPAPQDPSSQAA